MVSQLHQAVELAQAGRRDEARGLLLHYLQGAPDNEVAWLWLASVAADQPEYVRALNEVLRINPNNAQARQLLEQFRQQYGDLAGPRAPSLASAPTIPPSGPPPSPPRQTPPPSAESYEGVVIGASDRPPVAPAPPYAVPPTPAQPIQAGPPQVVEKVRVVEKKRRDGLGCGFPGCFGCLGCGGCWQSCLVTVLLIIVLPAVACGLLGLAPFSLGPLDFPASFLPDDLGRKTIQIEGEQYEVEVSVPRSWYLADANNDMWKLWRDVLNEVLPFADGVTMWKDLEGSGQSFTIAETNPAVLGGVLGDGVGAPVTLVVHLDQVMSQDLTCDAVRANAGTYTTIYEFEGGLCGYRQDDVVPVNGGEVFTNVKAPQSMHAVTFVTPIDRGMGLYWTLEMPEDVFAHFKQDIDVLIESVKVNEI